MKVWPNVTNTCKPQSQHLCYREAELGAYGTSNPQPPINPCHDAPDRIKTSLANFPTSLDPTRDRCTHSLGSTYAHTCGHIPRADPHRLCFTSPTSLSLLQANKRKRDKGHKDLSAKILQQEHRSSCPKDTGRSVWRSKGWPSGEYLPATRDVMESSYTGIWVQCDSYKERASLSFLSPVLPTHIEWGVPYLGRSPSHPLRF